MLIIFDLFVVILNIKKEMSNPHVRPFLSVLPEDAGAVLANAYQGTRWLREMDPDLLTPMIKEGNQDFFIFEPAILKDRQYCIPERWFTRARKTYALAWKIRPMIVNGMAGWVVYKYEKIEVAACSFSVSFPFFKASYLHRNVPDPSRIHGTFQFIEISITLN